MKSVQWGTNPIRSIEHSESMFENTWTHLQLSDEVLADVLTQARLMNERGELSSRANSTTSFQNGPSEAEGDHHSGEHVPRQYAMRTRHRRKSQRQTHGSQDLVESCFRRQVLSTKRVHWRGGGCSRGLRKATGFTRSYTSTLAAFAVDHTFGLFPTCWDVYALDFSVHYASHLQPLKCHHHATASEQGRFP